MKAQTSFGGNAVRPLTDDEIQSVAGAGDVVVYGYDDPSDPYWGNPVGSGNDTGYYQYPTLVPGGGGGAAPSYPANWDATRDHNIDHLASDLASKINQHTDHNSREYMGFIWKDANGNLHESNIESGTDTGVDPGNYSLAQWGIPSWAAVVAEMHNHPEYDAQGNFQNNYQSPSVGDMQGLQQFGHNSGVDSQFRSYIVYGSSVDEYDYAVNSSQTFSGQPRDVAQGAQLGDYNP